MTAVQKTSNKHTEIKKWVREYADNLRDNEKELVRIPRTEESVYRMVIGADSHGIDVSCTIKGDTLVIDTFKTPGGWEFRRNNKPHLRYAMKYMLRIAALAEVKTVSLTTAHNDVVTPFLKYALFTPETEWNPDSTNYDSTYTLGETNLAIMTVKEQLFTAFESVKVDFPTFKFQEKLNDEGFFYVIYYRATHATLHLMGENGVVQLVSTPDGSKVLIENYKETEEIARNFLDEVYKANSFNTLIKPDSPYYDNYCQYTLMITKAAREELLELYLSTHTLEALDEAINGSRVLRIATNRKYGDTPGLVFIEGIYFVLLNFSEVFRFDKQEEAYEVFKNERKTKILGPDHKGREQFVKEVESDIDSTLRMFSEAIAKL